MKQGTFNFSTNSCEKTTIILAGGEHSSVVLDYGNVESIIVEFAKPSYNFLGYTNVKFMTVATEMGELLHTCFHNHNVVVNKHKKVIFIYVFKNKNIIEENND